MLTVRSKGEPPLVGVSETISATLTSSANLSALSMLNALMTKHVSISTAGIPALVCVVPTLHVLYPTTHHNVGVTQDMKVTPSLPVEGLLPLSFPRKLSTRAIPLHVDLTQYVVRGTELPPAVVFQSTLAIHMWPADLSVQSTLSVHLTGHVETSNVLTLAQDYVVLMPNVES